MLAFTNSNGWILEEHLYVRHEEVIARLRICLCIIFVSWHLSLHQIYVSYGQGSIGSTMLLHIGNQTSALEGFF